MDIRTEPTGPTPQTRLLKRREVEQLTGLGKSTIYDLMARGLFPRPVQISAHAVRWHLDEILHYIRTRPRSGSGRRRKK